MAAPTFNTLKSSPVRLGLLAAGLALVLVCGLLSAFYMESNGHKVTGMTNQIVWGLPHVFAIFLIVAASGALNVASIASVFGQGPYKLLAPLSALVAISLLAGGLMVLVLDLGRPDRLLVAMLHQNPRSIFAWNVVLYSGFFAVASLYLVTMMNRRLNKYSHYMGMGAFIWRIILTTGTGSIFGFLVARDAFHSAVMAPMFIAMSFSYGLAVFLLVLLLCSRLGGPAPGEALMQRLERLFGIFIAAQLYFILALHLTNLYAANGRSLEDFVLVSGGIYPLLFWVGTVLLSSLIPLWLLFSNARFVMRLVLAPVLVVIGGMMNIYTIVIGGQAVPMSILPGYTLQSSFGDGQIATYSPTVPEFLLGMGGVSLALIMVLAGVSVLKFLPVCLNDSTVAKMEHRP